MDTVIQLIDKEKYHVIAPLGKVVAVEEGKDATLTALRDYINGGKEGKATDYDGRDLRPRDRAIIRSVSSLLPKDDEEDE